MIVKKWLFSVTVGLCAFISNIQLGAAVRAEDIPYYVKMSEHFTATSSETLDGIGTVDIELNSPSAIQKFGEIRIPINENFTDFEVVEAYTLKVDGTKIPVPQDKILISAAPDALEMGFFEADIKIHSIIFSDITPGDHIHYTSKTHEKSSPLAGGFQEEFVFPASARYGEVEISLDAPTSLNIHRVNQGLSETVAEQNGRKTYVWTLTPQSYRADEPGSTAEIDRDPHIFISSYPDSKFVGQKFFDGAQEKSAQTPEIQSLADTITKGTVDRKEQARAISDWVSKNVRYMAIDMGNGGYLPHDAKSILAAKYGDCKDHTTIMRALLAAKGIVADYALINIGQSTYQAMGEGMRLYDHVILYLPEFDLYTDPTSRYSAFGTLPTYEADKPILRAGADGVTVVRTPALNAQTNRLKIIADVTLRPDGTPDGSATIEASGPISASLRYEMDKANDKGPDAFARELLNKQNWHGAGNIELKDATDHADPYVVKTSFVLTNRFFGNGPNKNAIPTGPRLIVPLYTAPVSFLQDERTQDFVCQAGTFEQIIDLHLPDGQSLAHVPQDSDVSTPLASFKATYKLDGQKLHVERRFVSNVVGQVCKDQTAKEMAPAVLAASHDVSTRLKFTTEGADSGMDEQ